ncbi:MAG TPA: hypothetical protein VF666_14550 [Pyrinomonadaceae bacterium]|jgi:hypothetical protein
MSDYLWDKSGEPDADIEHLENLLGTLRHQPRALELPTEAHTFQSRRTFSRPALAVAAALVVMILAGVWFGVVQQRDARRDSPTIAANPATLQTTTERATEATREATPEVAVQTTPSNVGTESKTAPGIEPERQKQQVVNFEPNRKFRTRVATRAASPKQRRRLDADGEHGVRSHEATEMAAAPTPRNTRPELATLAAADLAERQKAKEQLMLALRLTTAKLSFVQTKTNEKSRGTGGAKPVYEERNRIR